MRVASAEDTCAILCLRYLALVLQQQSKDIDSTQTSVKEGILDGRYSLFFYAYEHWGSHLVERICASPNSDFGRDLDKQVHLFDGVLQQYGGVIPTISRSAEVLCEQWAQSPLPQSSSTGLRNPYMAIIDLLTMKWHLDFEALRHAAIKINNALRTLVLSNSMPNGVADRRKLRAIYGEKLRKCTRPDCMMFLIGFEDEKTLRRHESAHEWNVMCHVVECPRSRFGFRSQAQREDHIATTHSDFDCKDVDVETTPSVSCVQSYIACQEKDRAEILREVILSGDVELAADLGISFQGNLKAKDLLDLAVQSKSVTMAKLVTDKLELKKSFLNGTKPVFEISKENVVSAFLWAVQLDCRDIITFFLKSEFVSDLATRMIPAHSGSELYKLVPNTRLPHKGWGTTVGVNALIASLILNGNNQFKFIISHNINVDGPLHWQKGWFSTADTLLCWSSPNHTKIWSLICQLFENGADVNIREPKTKNTIVIAALQLGWQDRIELDAIYDLARFGANFHEKTHQVGA